MWHILHNYRFDFLKWEFKYSLTNDKKCFQSACSHQYREQIGCHYSCRNNNEQIHIFIAKLGNEYKTRLNNKLRIKTKEVEKK